MADTKFVKGRCKKTGRYFGLDVKQFKGIWKVTNMTDIDPTDALIVSSEVKQSKFETNKNLLPCLKCGNRTVGGCKCSPKRHQCSNKMKYTFDCIYCNEFEIDYSLPSRSAVGKMAGGKVTLPQGQEVQITFSNAEWQKFDKVIYHPAAPADYHEPQIHVSASEENIEFHGYNVSNMDEGVTYTIDRKDDFEIECDIDTSTIQPHPGGYLYINLGIITAQLTEKGGSIYLDGKMIGVVGSRFHLHMVLKSGGYYEVYVDQKLLGKKLVQKSQTVDIIFGFAHESHYCALLSHAYIKNIKMKQCTN